jgi:DNA-binding NtrC family response regulator
MTRQTNASILFVDDDINILLSLKRLVYDMNLEVHTAITAEEGLDILRKVTLILLSQIKVCQA